MKLLSATILSVALLLSMAICAGAQDTASSIPPLIAGLKLSKGQKKVLEPAYTDHYRQIREVMGGNLSTDEKKARLGVLNSTMNDMLNKTLNSDQRKMLTAARGK